MQHKFIHGESMLFQGVYQQLRVSLLEIYLLTLQSFVSLEKAMKGIVTSVVIKGIPWDENIFPLPNSDRIVALIRCGIIFLTTGMVPLKILRGYSFLNITGNQL